MKKLCCLILAFVLFTPVAKLAAQTFQGDATPGSFSLIGLEDTASISAGSVALQFTINPTAVTFQFDSLTINNLEFSTITTSYAIGGFGSSSQANVSINFDPINFVLGAPPSSTPFPNPVPLLISAQQPDANGASACHYRISTAAVRLFCRVQ